MSAWANFTRSPLCRHPSLFTRKVAQRLGLSPRLDFDAAPPSLACKTPDHLAAALRTWIQRADLHNKPHPFGRVFQQDFEEERLLGMCKTGPQGTPDLLGDIKLIWEFSRGYAFTLNAAQNAADAGRVLAPHLHAWLKANADPRGVNWQCAMEVAIRAVNWICADALSNHALRHAVGPPTWDRWLWLHGHAIWTNLEARIISSNHYVANVLGLLFVGACFPDDARARAWHRWAQSEMPHVLATQTREDGGVYEASLPYHALVTEMALLYLMMENASAAPATRERIRGMCQVIADTMDIDGDVFRVGDDDGGRVIPLDFASRTMGRGQIILALAETILGESWTPQSRLYPQSGWWIARRGPFAVLLEFGGVGMAGLGAHAHNDTLSLCVNVFGRRLLVDPGTYLYTSSPSDRNRFRSTSCHNTFKIDRREQLPILPGAENIFRLAGPDRALRVIETSDCEICVAGPHPGMSRAVRVSDRRLIITDCMDGQGTHSIDWFFQWAPDLQPEMRDGRITVATGGRCMTLSASVPLQLILADSAFSPHYGHCVPNRQLRASWQGALPCTVTWTLEERM